MEKRSLFENTTIVVVAQTWSMLLALVATPYVVRSLGAEGYGMFSLILILANYLSIIDFGFGWAIIKFVSECAAENDLERMEGIIGTTIWLTLFVGVFLALILYTLAPWLVDSAFNTPIEKSTVMQTGVIMAGICLLLSTMSNIFGGILKGLQRFDLATGAQALFLTIRMAGYVFLLKLGYGLISLWTLTLVAMFFCIVTYGISINRLLPTVSLFPKFKMTIFRTIFSFSAYSFFTRLLTMPYFYLDKIFISALLPMSAISHYVIPFNLAQRIGNMGVVAVSVLFPSASEHAKDREEFCKLYRRTVKIAYAAIVPVVLVAVTLGPEFISFWISAEFGKLGRLPLILISIGFGAATLGGIDGTFTEGIGRPKIRTVIFGALCVVSLPACYFLTEKFGINGTAATVCLAFLVGGVFDILYFQVAIMKNWWYPKKILTRVVILSATGLPLGWSARVFVSGLWSTMLAGTITYLALVIIGARILHTSEQFRTFLSHVTVFISRILKGSSTMTASFSDNRRD